MIIADNSNRKKRIAVLTAECFESELIEMDSSGMRENVIIDLNYGIHTPPRRSPRRRKIRVLQSPWAKFS